MASIKYWYVWIVGLVVVVGCAAAGAPTPSAAALPDNAGAIQRLAAGAPVPVDTQRHGQSFQVEHTMNGITVTLIWAAADHDRVLLGYTIHGAADRVYEVRDIALATRTGERFPGGVLMGAGGVSDLLEGTVPPHYFVNLADFETVAGAGPGSDVRLTLNVEERARVPQPPPPSLLDRLRTLIQSPEDTQAITQPAVPGPTTGPFVFDLTLPHQ